MSHDGVITAETLNVAALNILQQLGTVVTLVNGNTISATPGVVRVTAAGAITGVIVTAGTKGGQLLIIINEAAAASTLTMAAAGTSNVAAGVTAILSGLAAHIFV